MYNNFKQIPPIISKLENLKILDLNCNYITNLSEEILNHPTLTTLNLEYNNLQGFPKNIPKRKKKLFINLSVLPITILSVNVINLGLTEKFLSDLHLKNIEINKKPKLNFKIILTELEFGNL